VHLWYHRFMNSCLMCKIKRTGTVALAFNLEGWVTPRHDSCFTILKHCKVCFPLDSKAWVPGGIRALHCSSANGAGCSIPGSDANVERSESVHCATDAVHGSSHTVPSEPALRRCHEAECTCKQACLGACLIRGVDCILVRSAKAKILLQLALGTSYQEICSGTAHPS